MLNFNANNLLARLRIAIVLWLVLCLRGVHAQEAPMAVSPTLPVGQVDPTLPRRVPDYLRSATLPEPVRLARLAADEARIRKRGPLTSTGVRRFVADALTRRAKTASLADGRTVPSVSITSPGAKRVRIHFRDFDAGDGEVWVYAPGSETAPAPYTGKGIFGDGEFWSASVEGDTAIVASVGSSRSSPAHVPFAVDAISHQWLDPTPMTTAAASSDPAAPCNLDVTCYPSYQSVSLGVAMYEFVSSQDGGMYVCSGSLVNTHSGSFKPYFLTAHHCIGSTGDARTIEAYFFRSDNGLQWTAPHPYEFADGTWWHLFGRWRHHTGRLFIYTAWQRSSGNLLSRQEYGA